jgi:hypothetical protein
VNIYREAVQIFQDDRLALTRELLQPTPAHGCLNALRAGLGRHNPEHAASCRLGVPCDQPDEWACTQVRMPLDSRFAWTEI